jgi:hypothetical protein
MYEEFKKPGILKHIPIPLIRALPCIYYYNKYRSSRSEKMIIKFLDSNINYLDETLVYMSNRLDIHQFKDISRTIYRLKKDNSTQYSLHYKTAIEKLACVCECHIDKIKKFTKSEKNKLNDIYNNNILKLNIMLINTHKNVESHKKLSSILKNNCNYDVESTNADNTKYPDQIIKSDLVIMDSTFSPEVHQQMNSLNSFKKPGIALVPIEGNTEEDRISLRHGNQIKKKGYHVIYKSFTPIRLFTSIDREYLKYNLTKH